MADEKMLVIEVGDVVEWKHEYHKALTLVSAVRDDGKLALGGSAFWEQSTCTLIAKASAPLLKRIEELTAEVELLKENEIELRNQNGRIVASFEERK